MQLETCHLGRVQGSQRTRHTGHSGARPRLSEADKERLAQRRAFTKALLRDLREDCRWDEISEQDWAMLRYRFINGLTQAETARILSIDQATVSRREEQLCAYLKLYFQEGA